MKKVILPTAAAQGTVLPEDIDYQDSIVSCWEEGERFPSLLTYLPEHQMDYMAFGFLRIIKNPLSVFVMGRSVEFKEATEIASVTRAVAAGYEVFVFDSLPEFAQWVIDKSES